MLKMRLCIKYIKVPYVRQSCISGVMGTDKILGKLKFTFFGLLKHVARCCSQYKLYDMTNQLG